MPDYRFVRLWRTSQSEAYEILDAQEPLARIDLHYTSSVVYGLMILEKELPEEGVQDLIEVIDSEIVDSVDTPREDFLVSVYLGTELGTYSDDVFGDLTEVDAAGDGNHGSGNGQGHS